MEAAGHWSGCGCVAGAGGRVREFGVAGGCIVLGSGAPIWCVLVGHDVQHWVHVGESGGLPQLKLRPASGPVGTYVTISGQLNPGQVRANEPYFRHPAYFNLITDVWADCAKAPHAYPYDCSAGPRALRAVN